MVTEEDIISDEMAAERSERDTKMAIICVLTIARENTGSVRDRSEVVQKKRVWS